MISEETIERLVHVARQAKRRAYAPYSQYPVGAAVLAASGRVYSGCNVENAVYGLTVCAERVAVCSAVAAGEREIAAVAVATANAASPCGACRQVLAEFAPTTAGHSEDMLVILADDKSHRFMHLGDLLPSAFGRQHLSREG